MATKPKQRELRTIPITALTTGLNVRVSSEPDADLIASVKANGVLQPPTVTPTPEGTFEIVFGHRRAAAAAKAGLTQLEVIVVDQDLAADMRLTEQLVENDQRLQLTDAERVGGYRQLELLSVSPADIARRVGVKSDKVKKALAVAQSEHAVGVLADHDLTLDQAAAVLEFEDDPADVEQLRTAAKEHQFDHAAAQIRHRRALQAAAAEEERKFAEAGYTILGEKPATVGYQDVPAEPVALVDGAGYWISEPVYATPEDLAARNRMTPEQHATCPGRAVFVIAEDDWDDDDNLIPFTRHYEYCLDWVSNGHHRSTDGKAPKKDPAAMSEQELEKLELEKAERRRVRENNKSWPLATGVRRTWISDTLLQQKKLPANADLIPALWAASLLPKESYNGDLDTAKTWLGITSKEHWLPKVFEQHLTAADGPTATRTMLAIALAAVEAQLGYNDAWRSKAQSGLGRYLSVLQSWGYEPAPLELELITAHAKGAKKR